MACRVGVAEYYAGKAVLVTGATGFMGRVLVEKLLRSCPAVGTLYLLVRPRKGLSAQRRLHDFVNCEVFDRIQAEFPKSLHKLRLVEGDSTKDKLGLSDGDREELRRECQIIFHCAATVRFDEFIREAVEVNVTGTYKLLQFAETMEKLEVFLHVSTAYCHDYLDVLEEKLYPSKHRPQDIMALVKWMDEESLKAIEHRLTSHLPNTYAYAKELSEDLVSQYAGKFTVAIARPSVVVSSYREPIPGWMNNLNGPTGLQVAAAKGVLRVMHTYKDIQPDVMPVDMAINGVILLAYTTGLERPKEIRVCNITNSGLNTMSWTDMVARWSKYITKYPYSVCIWYPNLTNCESRLLYRLQALLFHWLPALFIDALLTLFRRKRFMIEVQKRLHHGLELLSHYITGSWDFRNDYFLSLRHRISPEEREIFYTEYDKLNIDEYINVYTAGARQYAAKDPPSTLERAKKQLKILYILHITVRVIFVWWILNLLFYMIKLFWGYNHLYIWL